ncbi:hypothetical protein V1502_09560 [Bacillus sp. SCS-153A]|uniref:hypothetical protein n=1 Tax=Rossellomorea sedimentorum TaxID=3115294 RepID=UPI0039059E08
MKSFFTRYSHWLFLFIVVFSFFTMFIEFKASTFDMIAIMAGAIGLLFVGYLTFIVEKKIRNQGNQN